MGVGGIIGGEGGREWLVQTTWYHPQMGSKKGGFIIYGKIVKIRRVKK